MTDALRYQRRLALAGAVITLVEIGAVVGPLAAFFPLDERQRWLTNRVAPVVLGGAWLIWWVATRYRRGPLDRAIKARHAGQGLDATALQLASRVTMLLPRRAALLRALVGTLAALLIGALLVARAGLPARALLTIVSVTAFHGLTVEVFRALAWAWVLDRVRAALVPDSDALRQFRDLYRLRLWRAALATGALAALATAAFAVFFLPISLEQYRSLETWFPATIFPLSLLWLVIVDRLCRPLELYLSAATSPDPRRRPGPGDPEAQHAFRTAEWLPYRLGATKLGIAILGEAALCIQAVSVFAIDVETAVLFFGEAVVVTAGATLYEVLWHRATLRPVLAHLASRHRPSVSGLDPVSAASWLTGGTRTPFSLRSKMLGGFGSLTIFACGLSLFWSFVQYKTLATALFQRETEIRRDRIVANLGERLSGLSGEAARQEIAVVLRGEAQGDAVIYYLPPEEGAVALAFGGGKQGAPPLRERDRAVMQRLDRGELDMSDLHLTGTYVRLLDGGGASLGSFALMVPGYRGRGASISRPIKVLLFFFVLLIATSMGIVVLIANDLTRPIRILERRAAAMARGDLNRPVMPVAGELDEVGRLTLAFEEMRRALDEKLRSSTEINLSLEQEVSRRTAELSRRNRELADALEALQRAQAELVRSEKMASMGRLVAGIAHEINNPVNAVVNTVGPLGSAIDELTSVAAGAGAGTGLGLGTGTGAGAGERALSPELVGDVQEMLRVIRSGARRTKEIVQALHNYSRGDDHTQSAVDVHRGLDESLDLLRHHLKQGIRVERGYSDVGRVLGNEGQLQQVFMNLLTNAAQAIGDRMAKQGTASGGAGGTIRIDTARNGSQVTIRIADDGPGIAEDVLPRIFDPFFTTKDVGQGSGLGLSIVHGIIERHGGTIRVDSKLGEGTTFTVTLPSVDGPSPSASAGAPASQKTRASA